MKIFNFRDIYPIRNALVFGLLLRLIAIFLILAVFKDSHSPYFVVDDINYEAQGLLYLNSASSVIDINAMDNVGAFNNIAPFWPTVMCVTSKLFGTEYASRFINIILSLLCVIAIYKLTLSASKNIEAAVMASKLYAYLPLPVFLACFPLKDLFLTFATLVLFNFIVIVNKNLYKLKQFDILFVLLLCVGIHFCRGAIVEMFVIFLMASILLKGIRNRKFSAIFLSIIVSLVTAYFFMDEIIGSFATKITDYQDVSEGATLISRFQVKGISTLYNLPFQYFLASLLPIDFNYSQNTGDQFWRIWVSQLNVSMIPVAVANMWYFFKRDKYDWFFWICTFIIYSSVISLSLSIFRHFLFLLPLQIMNCAMFVSTASDSNKKIIWGFSIVLLTLLLLRTYF